ncbi:MAG: UDP-N-acetylglucosamine 2-epimerase (non-hydrolyzing) [Candidatus Cloacimonetes bacterium]|jgi:UDP-GlcNAc3NAcA epimerase|nr:UDP-N-acetylglucosamine 2-epimerase (non-hydrolyzing) [Candidatus Cloacimonadota bacterium]
MKLITIIGARPQFIKAAAVSREIAKHSEIKEIIVHTGQHFDANMSEIFFEQMHIPKPDYNLEINSLSHGAMTGRMIEKIEEVLLDEKPDWILIYGDTNSTIAGSLAAKKLHIKVAHVEAGLRSFNRNMPEEINRILTDKISDILFCPTDTAVQNLQNEGIGKNSLTQIVKCGDVMQDAAIFYTDLAQKPEIEVPEEFILATIHRAENTDDPKRLTSIFNALNKISHKLPIILPLHPRTKKIISISKLITTNSQLIFIDPVGYLEMIYLLQNCSLVMTDSGGLQKEAFFFRKPCVTLRDETEWVELVENGFNEIVGANENKIISGYKKMSKKQNDYKINLYGNGEASEKIINKLLE